MRSRRHHLQSLVIITSIILSGSLAADANEVPTSEEARQAAERNLAALKKGMSAELKEAGIDPRKLVISASKPIKALNQVELMLDYEGEPIISMGIGIKRYGGSIKSHLIRPPIYSESVNGGKSRPSSEIVRFFVNSLQRELRFLRPPPPKISESPPVAKSPPKNPNPMLANATQVLSSLMTEASNKAELTKHAHYAVFVQELAELIERASEDGTQKRRDVWLISDHPLRKDRKGRISGEVCLPETNSHNFTTIRVDNLDPRTRKGTIRVSISRHGIVWKGKLDTSKHKLKFSFENRFPVFDRDRPLAAITARRETKRNKVTSWFKKHFVSSKSKGR